MTTYQVIRYEVRLADYYERDQLESIYEAWDLNRERRGQDDAPEFYVREA